jgi:hypothetical protein
MNNEEKQIVTKSDLQLLNQLKEYLQGIENVLYGLILVDSSDFRYHMHEMNEECLNKIKGLETVIKTLNYEQSRENIS